MEHLEEVPRRWESFLDAAPHESDFSRARVVVLPVPYDSTTSYRTGARHGPKAIIAASRELEDYDPELDRDIFSLGIYTAPELAPDLGSPEAMMERVRRAVLPLARAGKLVCLLGGEHSVTVGAVQAMREAYPDLSVLYLDAHADLRDEYMGTRWGHASAARRVYELCPLVQVGVRSLSAEEMEFIRDTKLPVFFWTGDVPAPPVLAAQALEHLSRRVYVSVDLDVLDPSLMAAVGTPEPGGMGWRELTGLLRAIAQQRQIVGFDIVELSPQEGPEACAYTAAKLAYKLMGYATAT